MVTNGQMQIANGMRSDGSAMAPDRLEVRGDPAVVASRCGAQGPEATTSALAEDLEIPGAR